MKRTIITTVIIALVTWLHYSNAQEKGMEPFPPGGMPRLSGMPMPQLQPQIQPLQPQMQPLQKIQPPIRAEDWVNAWQMAKEACSNADTLTIQMADRSGPSWQGLNVFECIDLKASGELLIITVKKPDKQEESAIIIRSSDMLRIEVTKRASAQD